MYSPLQKYWNGNLKPPTFHVNKSIRTDMIKWIESERHSIFGYISLTCNDCMKLATHWPHQTVAVFIWNAFPGLSCSLFQFSFVSGGFLLPEAAIQAWAMMFPPSSTNRIGRPDWILPRSIEMRHKTFCIHVLWTDETKMKLDQSHGNDIWRKKGSANHVKHTSSSVNHGGGNKWLP